MKLLRQSTEQVVQFGPFVDIADGVTLETGLATAMDNATTGIRVSKDGAAYADRNSATAPSYDAMGDYRITLSTTDTNTVGILKMIFEEAATCLPVWQEFMVVSANVYDALTGADTLDVNVIEWLGTAAATPTTAGVPEVDVTFVSGAAEDIATETKQNTAQTDLDTITGTDGATLATAQALYAPAKAGDNMGTVSSVTGNVDGNVTGSVGSNLELGPTEVNAEVDTAIETYGLDHLVSAAVIGTDVTDNSIVAKLVSSSATADWDDFVNTSDSLQATRDHIGDGTNLTEAGGTGDQLTGITGVQLAADQAVDATKFGGAAVTATTSVTIPAASTLATTTGAVGSVTGSVGSNVELGPTEVLAQVNAALDTAISELGVGAPTATPDIREALMLMYMALRNKTVVQTSGTDALEIYNDAGTKIASKVLTDDGSDYTEAEMS